MRVLGFIGTVFVLFIMIPLLYGSFCLFGLDFEAYSSIPVFFPVLIFLGIFIISSLVGFMKGKDCTCLLFGWHYKDTKTGKTYGVLKMFMASLIHFCIWLPILGVLEVYIDSDLLENEMLEFYNGLLIKHLKDAIEMEASLEKYNYLLLKAYLSPFFTFAP